MDLYIAATLFSALFLLAAVPAPSVYMVITKTTTSGLRSGLIFIAGLILGDIIFILMALYGLSAIANTFESGFKLLNYVGGGYLLWLGYRIWRKQNVTLNPTAMTASSFWSSLLTGLLITLSDPRAVIFYVSFLPAFIDLSQFNFSQIITLMLCTIFAVGGAKLMYALAALKVQAVTLKTSYTNITHRLAAMVMASTGVYLIVRQVNL